MSGAASTVARSDHTHPAPPFQFEATVRIGPVNATTSPIGASTMTTTVDARIIGWKAPRTCTVSGTFVVVGGPTASQFSVLARVRDASGMTILRSSSVVFDTSYVPGTVRTVAPVVINAGELLTLVEIANVGLALQDPTVVYSSLVCQ